MPSKRRREDQREKAYQTRRKLVSSSNSSLVQRPLNSFSFFFALHVGRHQIGRVLPPKTTSVAVGHSTALLCDAPFKNSHYIRQAYLWKHAECSHHRASTT